MISEDKNPSLEQELIDVVIISSYGQLSLSVKQNSKFDIVAKQFCEHTGWMLNKTRFILDGDRLRNDLTLLENEVHNHAVLDAFQEVFGGKGPTDKEILQMLEECDADTEDVPELDEGSNKTDIDYKWYEDLKLELKGGSLILDRSNSQDEKLLFLLETDNLQPYEIVRLRNIYSCWEQTKLWRKEDDRSKPARKKQKVKSTLKPSNREKGQKNNIHDLSRFGKESNDEVTPNKRKKFMESLDLTTPSPLIRNTNLNEREMKRMSVAVHLWAERKMAGVQYLHTNRLKDSQFEDILEFTGPTSKWKLMKGRTLAQLRSLWRNSFGGKHFHRGHKKTGFENEFQRHVPSDPFCPFGHCSSGLMSPMDVDLVVLTPQKECFNVSDEKKTFSSRKLFKENSVNDDLLEDEEETSNKEILKVTTDSPLTARKRSVESFDEVSPLQKDEVNEDVNKKKIKVMFARLMIVVNLFKPSLDMRGTLLINTLKQDFLSKKAHVQFAVKR